LVKNAKAAPETSLKFSLNLTAQPATTTARTIENIKTVLSFFFAPISYPSVDSITHYFF